MTIAIVGGTGFLGPSVARRLLARGEDVLVIARGRHPVDLPEDARLLLADRTDEARLTEIFWRNGVDAVIDIFALSENNTRPVREAAAAQGARYVLVSSVDVYANYAGLLGMEQPPVREAPATEDAPLRQTRYPYRGNPRRPHGVDADLFENYDKLPLEEAARADDRLRETIVRLPMIFGPRDKQHRFGWAVNAIDAGGPIRLDRRAAEWRNSYLFVEDAGEALALAATHPAAIGRTYNVAQADIRTVRQWIEKLQRLIGSTAPIELVEPEARGLQADRADSSDMRYPLTLDGARIRGELGYAETVSEDEALLAAIAYERASG